MMRGNLVAPYNPDIGAIEDEMEEFMDAKQETIEDLLAHDSEESEQEMFNIDDPEINAFKKTIPTNWDLDF